MPPDRGLSPEVRSQITDIQDHLIELAVDKADAVAAGDQAQTGHLQREIDALARQIDGLR